MELDLVSIMLVALNHKIETFIVLLLICAFYSKLFKWW